MYVFARLRGGGCVLVHGVAHAVCTHTYLHICMCMYMWWVYAPVYVFGGVWMCALCTRGRKVIGTGVYVYIGVCLCVCLCPHCRRQLGSGWVAGAQQVWETPESPGLCGMWPAALGAHRVPCAWQVWEPPPSALGCGLWLAGLGAHRMPCACKFGGPHMPRAAACAQQVLEPPESP